MGMRSDETQLSPLVFLPGAGGINPAVAAFAKHSEERLPLVLLDYPDWSWQLEHPSFEMLISEVAQRISVAVPRAPLGVAGYSLGAPIAALVVSKLIASGHDVRWIAAIDPVMPGSTELGRDRRARLGRAASAAISAGWRSGARYAWMMSIRTAGRLMVPLLLRLGRRGRRLMGVLARPGSLLAHQFNVRLMIRSAARWQMPPSPVPKSVRCTLMRTVETAPDIEFWQSQFSEVKMIEVDGDHHTLFGGRLVDLLLAGWRCACRRPVAQ
jgi:thioesterase domain-containing protein